ncbi:MAG: hypothetical protein HRT88_21005, partial [Lentisphaeraceae bacterium]|nr:hypothetical protein [Lentisphaeraceae bacterium]
LFPQNKKQHKKKKHWPAIIISICCALGFIISSMTFTAPDSEFVIVTRFGAYKKTADEGLNFKWPYPIEDTVRFDKRIQHLERPLTQTALADVRNLLVSVTAEWKIVDPEVFQKTLVGVKSANSRLKTIIGTATGTVFGRYSLGQIYTVDKKKHKLEEIRSKILLTSQKEAKQNGIEVVNIGFTQSAFAPSATASVFKMMISERKRKSEELRNKGKEDAEAIIRTAKAEAEQRIATANIEAEAIRRKADIDVTKIYTKLENPELVAFLRQLDSLKVILKKKTQMVIDLNTPPFNILKGEFIEGLKNSSKVEKK